MTHLVEAVQREHRKILGLVERLEEKSAKWPLGEHAARKAVHDLVALEARHEAAEERFVWPLVRDLMREHAAIRETALSQEREARWLLHRLHKAAGTETAVEMVPAVAQAIRIHVGLEDSQVLPGLADSLPRKESFRLGPQYEQASASGPTRPHPRTPAIPGVLALVSPLASRADRLRDLLRLR